MDFIVHQSLKIVESGVTYNTFVKSVDINTTNLEQLV